MDVNRCRVFVEDPAPEVQLSIGAYTLTKLKRCFSVFKAMVLDGRQPPGDGGGGGGNNGNSQLQTQSLNDETNYTGGVTKPGTENKGELGGQVHRRYFLTKAGCLEGRVTACIGRGFGLCTAETLEFVWQRILVSVSVAPHQVHSTAFCMHRETVGLVTRCPRDAHNTPSRLLLEWDVFPLPCAPGGCDTIAWMLAMAAPQPLYIATLGLYTSLSFGAEAFSSYPPPSSRALRPAAFMLPISAAAFPSRCPAPKGQRNRDPRQHAQAGAEYD